jgi:large subunit ribosomal protein L35
MVMPKMKTHSGAKKRVRVTGSGKLMRRQSGRGHYKLAKGKSTFRRRSSEVELAPGDAKVLKKQLGR